MGPHADHVCLSRKCRQEDGAAAVYDLPVGATRCPMCGSKRLQRLYNAINVSSGHAKRVDAIAEAPLADALALRDERRAAERRAPSLAVPLGQLGAALGSLSPQFGGMSLGGAHPGASVGTGVRRLVEDSAFELPRTPPAPIVVARDTEYRVTRGPDGMPRADRA